MFRNLSLFTGISLLFFSVLFSACNKSSDLGLTIVPDKYIFNLNTPDTFTVKAFTYKVDSVATNGYFIGVLGSYVDPVLGNVKASFITEIRHQLDSLRKGTNPVFDSMILYLRYDTISYTTIGKKDKEVQINIYEIKKRLPDSLVYYNNIDVDSLNPVLITSSSFIPKNVLRDTIVYLKDTMTQTLAVKLNQSFGQRIFDDYNIWNTQLLASYFNGFYITSDANGFYITSDAVPVDGALSFFNLASPYSRIRMFYHNDAGDSLKYEFNFNNNGYNNNSTNINLYEHQYNAPGFLPDLENPEAKQDSVVYIQGLGGLMAKIEFPYLDQLQSEAPWIVNRAELIVQSEDKLYTLEDDYPAPSELIIQSINDGKSNLLEEYKVISYDSKGSPYISGYRGVSYLNGLYVFDITYLVQKIVNGKQSNNALIITLPDGALNPSRVVLTSGNNSKKIQLKLSLTKP